MKKHRYVIVSSQGASLDFRDGPAKLPGLLQQMWYSDPKFQDLQDLLANGWRPVRETGMGGGSAVGGAVIAFSLVLLEKDSTEAAPPVVEAVQPK
jgi:hypothetical protein